MVFKLLLVAILGFVGTSKNVFGQLSVQKARLIGGDSPTNGRLEVMINNVWGTVCDNSWDNHDATVACRMLGFRSGIGYSNAKFGHGSGPILLHDVYCIGTETSLSECATSNAGVNHCSHYKDAGVQCFGSGKQEARLVDGYNFTNGRLEVMINNVWGTVCDDGWDNNDATVACRMLGFSHGIGYKNAMFGAGTDLIWLDDVRCIGTETSLLQCASANAGVHDCSHSEDASVQCFSEKQEARLVDGDNSTNGRLEVMINNVWGTVCDDGWDNNDATVVCRMLGFRSGIAYRKARFGRGSGPIWLDDVNCTGIEISLSLCESRRPGSHNCVHSEDASVQCFSGVQKARLIGGDSPTNGRLEVMINNVWGTVCDNSWDNHDATVACRMLGFRSGIAYRKARFGRGSGPIWLDDVNCTGIEISLSLCESRRPGSHNCVHSEDASVQCFSGIQQTRLIGGNNPTNGRLEVMINNVWGTVCDNSWDNHDATVACRMLGFSHGIGYKNAMFGAGTNQIWLDDVNCTGIEISLSLCESRRPGSHNCVHSEDASVQCFSAKKFS